MKIKAPRIDRSAAFGVAVFAMVGIGAGLAIKPSDRELIGPEGPQTLMPVSGARDATGGGQSAFAAYKYGIPDWVIGTDWLQKDQPPVAAQVVDDGYQPTPYEPPEYIPAAERPPAVEEIRTPPRYPSVGGDIYDQAPEPPAPVIAVAPPEPPEAPQATEPPVPPELPPA